jgi:hypothetical protein
MILFPVFIINFYIKYLLFNIKIYYKSFLAAIKSVYNLLKIKNILD